MAVRKIPKRIIIDAYTHNVEILCGFANQKEIDEMLLYDKNLHLAFEFARLGRFPLLKES